MENILFTLMAFFVFFTCFFAFKYLKSEKELQSFKDAAELFCQQRDSAQDQLSDAQDRIKDLTKNPPKSIEAQQILHDITAPGGAVLRITPISAENIFLRSPR